MRLPRLVLAALAAMLALVAAGCGGDDGEEGAGGETAATETAGGGAEGCGGSIAIMAPITGDAASIGQEQLNFAKFAVERFNEENGTSFRLVEGDTQLDPSQATSVAQRFASDDEILAVVGPAGSQEVEAVGPIFTRADLPFVSASATRTSLTESGDFPTFFRVVPTDAVQGPTAAEFMTEQLDAQQVVIIDDQTSYSTGLADSAAETLEESGATVRRESVSQDQNDFSALVSGIRDADVVFLPWQLANKAQVFGQQLAEQGSDAVIFGSDGLFSEDFAIEGAYVSSFAPDIKQIPESQDLVTAFEEAYGEFSSTFGPPVYAATQVVLGAASRACEGGEIERQALVEQIRQTDEAESILGQPISFDESGDMEGGKFFIFRVAGKGEYELQE